tara:strand:+ start:540 stop:1136 length:597 start_codon:yes stop_codon:yes gene_type:complete
MADPTISPDGKWMWTGTEWIPAPPTSAQGTHSNINLEDSMMSGDVNVEQGSTTASSAINLKDSAMSGDINITQNNAEDIASAMIQAMKHMSRGIIEDSHGNPPSSSIPVSPPSTGGKTFPQVGVRPQSPAAQPLHAGFQQVRPQIGQMQPQQFREMMVAGGSGRNPGLSPDEFLTALEARAQLSLSDPNQQLLSQYMY